MKCVFSLDDYCWHYRDCILFLDKLNSYFPEFKVSLFTIPCFEGIPLCSYWKELSDVRFKNEHILHGYYHSTAEFEHLTKQQALDYIKMGIEEFKRCDIPIVNGFKGPNWRYSPGTEEALKSIEFWLAPYRPTEINGLKTYHWNWDIGEPIPKGIDFLHAHGHTHSLSGPGKGIQDSMKNIIQLPVETEFLFISEVMK
jgi:hypothetical protein